jgi:hypothetical protein
VGELGSIKRGRVGINQAWESWDQSRVEELGSIKRGRVGINQAWESWDQSSLGELGSIKRGRIAIPLIDLTPPHLYLQ